MEAIDDVLAELHLLSKPSRIEGMKRFGIQTDYVIGVSIPHLRAIAKKHKKNHPMALLLWQTSIHEARILATMIDDANQVTELQMEMWAADFNSWDICDQCCGNLFDKTPFAFDKAIAWAARPEEYVKRAGFTLMATLAVHAKNTNYDLFVPFFELIIKHATDERNFVKKAVNWALRQMGKRHIYLYEQALATSKLLLNSTSKSAKWIGADALRELSNEKIQQRVAKKT